MNELKIFNNEEFGSVRSVMIDNEPWLVGKDVAVALGYENPQKAIRDHVFEEDKKMGERNVTPSIIDNVGREQFPTFINESGVYALVFGSKLDSAKRFKHWVTSEVLPEIRKTGGYQMPQTYAEALRALADKAEEAERLQIDNERMKPKEVFADAVTASDNAILVREFAKMMRQNGIDIGEKRLYKWLRANGYVCKDGTEPTQRAMEQGLFEVLERTVLKGDVPPKTVRTTKITGKGQVFFANKLLNREHANKE